MAPFRSKLDAAASGGLVLDVHLLAPDVLLYDLGVVHRVLAHPHLLLGHGALVDDDLLLGDRHHDLVLPYLGLGGLARHRHPLDADLLVPDRDLDPLAVGAHALADPHGPGLALAGAGHELLLAPLHPQLVLVLEVVAPALAHALVVALVLAELAGLGVAHGHARADGAGAFGAGRPRAAVLAGPPVAVVLAVGPAVGGPAPEPVVGTYLVLVLGGYLVVVVEARPVLDHALGLVDLDEALAIVHGRCVHRDEGGAGAEEAHLHPDVLGLVVLVEKEIVHLADLLPVHVAYRVPGVAALVRREPVGAMLHTRNLLA